MIKRSRLVQGLAKTDLDYVSFGFGLDLVTPSNQTKPGSLRGGRNVEIDINGGYRTASGYLKYDGTASGSNDAFYTVGYSAVSGVPIEVGDTVTEATGPTTAYVLVVNNDPENQYLVLVDIDGPGLESGMSLDYGTGVVEITTDQIAAGPTPLLGAIYKQQSSQYWQSFVGAVPGSGPIRGLFLARDTLYAFRNNVGATAAAMYKASSSGWTQVNLGLEIAFTSGGTQEIFDGDVIVGMTSAAFATVARVVLEDGSWDAGTASGKFIVADQTGTFVSETIEVDGSGNIGTVTGNSTAITLLPNGRFETFEYNFIGSADNKRIYGCDGVNKGFEFDPVSEVFVKISTGLTNDAPSHVVVHKEHLFFSYRSSALHSGIGTPYQWTALSGAAELGIGADVTAFKIQPGAQGGGTLAIFTLNRTSILYGNNSGEEAEGGWNLVDYRDEMGAKPRSVQEFGFTLMMDDRGITTLEALQDYGNFNSNVVSRFVQPIINSRKQKVIDSCINREKSQYRLFFSDKSALYVTTMNNTVLGITQQQFYHDVYCVVSGEITDGLEKTFFGSSDGWVYQMDIGTSFAGENIDMLMPLHFHNSKSARIDKKYHDASFEISGSIYSTFNFSYELAYGLPTTPQPLGVDPDIAINFSSPVWDEFVWDEFIWDGIVLAPSEVGLDGCGENISLIFSSNVNYSGPITFSGAMLRLSYLKQLRS